MLNGMTTTTLTLTGEESRDLVYSEADPVLGLEVEANEQIDTNRWSSIHRLVVKDRDGKFWAATYSKGPTEYQDERPFEDQAEVKFREVEKVAVTTYEYRPVQPCRAGRPPRGNPGSAARVLEGH